MVFDAIKELGGAQGTTGEELRLDTPDAGQSDIVFRVTGTFVGTIKCQRSANGKTSWTDLTVTNVSSGVQANPTAGGTFAARLTAADVAGRVIFSAWTSGKARVEAALVRV